MSAKLICRAAGRATAQLSEPRTAGRRPTAPLPVQQRTALAGCSVWRRIIAQMRDIASRTGKQNLPPKNARNADSAVLFCLSRQKLARADPDADLNDIHNGENAQLIIIRHYATRTEAANS
jgi:hypothetical protein